MQILHERSSEGLHVQLVWNSGTDCVYVEVSDWSTGDVFRLMPDRAKALDAFYHPFCYAADATDEQLAA